MTDFDFDPYSFAGVAWHLIDAILQASSLAAAATKEAKEAGETKTKDAQGGQGETKGGGGHDGDEGGSLFGLSMVAVSGSEEEAREALEKDEAGKRRRREKATRVGTTDVGDSREARTIILRLVAALQVCFIIKYFILYSVYVQCKSFALTLTFYYLSFDWWRHYRTDSVSVCFAVRPIWCSRVKRFTTPT